MDRNFKTVISGCAVTITILLAYYLLYYVPQTEKNAYELALSERIERCKSEIEERFRDDVGEIISSDPEGRADALRGLFIIVDAEKEKCKQLKVAPEAGPPGRELP